MLSVSSTPAVLDRRGFFVIQIIRILPTWLGHNLSTMSITGNSFSPNRNPHRVVILKDDVRVTLDFPTKKEAKKYADRKLTISAE